MSRQTIVQIADMKMARQDGSLITFALGSCVGIVFYDTRIKLAALLHVLLPTAIGSTETNLYKFADTGIKETLRKMAIMGASKPAMICKIAGGAKMFEVFGNSALGNVGQRNIAEVTAALQREGLKVSAQEVGGTIARTMSVDIATGKVSIRTIGKPDIIL